jgi:hypothetical protein
MIKRYDKMSATFEPLVLYMLGIRGGKGASFRIEGRRER